MDFSTALLLAPGFIAGLTLHEFAHAFVAYRLGDDTASKLGRLTLNPLKHLDLFGTLLLFVVGFGWAKPVPVNGANLRNPKQDMLWVSLAGPFSNLLLALTIGTILQLFFTDALASDMASTTSAMLLYAVWINAILAVFNMIPLPPLDGARLLEIFIPRRFVLHYLIFRKASPFILMGLVFVSAIAGIPIFSKVLLPVARPVFEFCLGGWWLV
jgi:Zn-dependent protease